MLKSASNTRGSDLRNTLALALATVVIGAPVYAATQQKPVATPVAEPAEVTVAAPTTTLDRIKAGGKIVFGFRPDAAPMSSRDASGQPSGYSVTLCNRVAEALKRDLALSALTTEWVPVGSGFGDLEQNRVDLICDSDEITLANREKVAFSIPIFPGGVSAVVRSDAAKPLQAALEERPEPYKPLWRGTPPPTLEHRTYAALVGSSTMDTLKARIASMRLTADVEPVASYEAGTAAVAKGDIDVLFGDRAQLLQAVQSSPDAKHLRVLTRRYTFTSLALALARNDDAFRLAVDRALTEVYEDPQFGALYTSTFGAPDADTAAFFRSVAVPK